MSNIPILFSIFIGVPAAPGLPLDQPMMKEVGKRRYVVLLPPPSQRAEPLYVQRIKALLTSKYYDELFLEISLGILLSHFLGVKGCSQERLIPHFLSGQPPHSPAHV